MADNLDDILSRLDGAAGAEHPYRLRLYVTGSSSRSQRAIANLRRILDKHLKDRCDLEIIDLYQQENMARDEQVVAAPTLVKEMPLPVRRIIGDLSDENRVLLALDLSQWGLPEGSE